MSLLQLIGKLEEERSLNQTLLGKMLDRLDDEAARVEEWRRSFDTMCSTQVALLEQTKDDLREEFAERDAALLRLIDGAPMPAIVSPTIIKNKESTDADIAA